MHNLATHRAQTFGAEGSSTYHVPSTILVLVVLLIPTKSYYIFISATTLLLIAFRPKVSATDNWLMRVVFGWALFYFAASGLRFYLYGQPNIDDFQELAKLLPLLLIFLFIRKFQQMRLRNVVHAALAYLSLDAIVSWLQFLKLNPSGIVSHLASFYNGDLHAQVAFGLSSVRALGLSPGPGQHGVLMLVLISVLLASFFSASSPTLSSIWGMLVAISVVLLSQSRTSLLALAAGSAILALLILLRGRGRERLQITIAIGTVVGLCAYLIQYIWQLAAIERLMRYGLGQSSFEARQEKWAHLLTSMADTPLLLLTGYGRDYFGAASRVFDNDYLYLVAVHGVVVTLALGLLICRFIWSASFNWKCISDVDRALLLNVVFGFVAGIGLVYFTDPKVSVLLALLISVSYWERRRSGTLGQTQLTSA